MAKNNAPLFEKLQTLIHITRPVNILMVIFGVFVTFVAGLGTVPHFKLLALTMVIGACVAGAGNAINDYYDYHIDKINRPDRPLPSGKITKKGLWAYAISLFSLGIFASLLLPNFAGFVFVVINTVLLCVYAYRLKHSGFFGDLIISYLVASVFIFVAVIIRNFKLGFILAVAAFFTNAAREILKDVEDVRGDQMFGARTLPLHITKKKAIIVVRSFLIVSILVSPLPFTLGILKYPYLLVVLIADIIFGKVIYTSSKTDAKSVSHNQRLIKFGALIALIAFLAGVIPL